MDPRKPLQGSGNDLVRGRWGCLRALRMGGAQPQGAGGGDGVADWAFTRGFMLQESRLQTKVHCSCGLRREAKVLHRLFISAREKLGWAAMCNAFSSENSREGCGMWVSQGRPPREAPGPHGEAVEVLGGDTSALG